MKTPHAIQRPRKLWTQEKPTPRVKEYFDAHAGEFSTAYISSLYPFEGPAARFFKNMRHVPPGGSFHHFAGRGADTFWSLKQDRIQNRVTADLLAAADHLGGQPASERLSAIPGGFGASSSDVWVALLDGGVGVELLLLEHPTTNRIQGYQRTTIRGPRVYRALLELLGLDWINRKLPGERVRPTQSEIAAVVNELLDRQNHTDRSPVT